MRLSVDLRAAPLGEVVYASTTQLTAQCIVVPPPETVRALPDPPPFGSVVRIGATVDAPPAPGPYDPFDTTPAPPGDEAMATIYAVVFHAETGALEPGRPLTAFGLDEETLRREQPQIYELLATRFSAALVAWAGDDGAIRPYLPPRPPRPHAQVFLAGDEELNRLTERLDFLRGLLLGERIPGGAADELVAALLRRAWRAAGGDEAFLLRAGRELASLLASDYHRLRALLQRIVG